MIKIAATNTLFNRQKLFKTGRDTGTVKRFSAEGKNMAVVYAHAEKELPAAVKEMLDKIIVACKFKPEQTIYLNNKFNKLSIGELLNANPLSLVIVFGEVALSRNLAKLKKNEPYEMNGTIIIQTEPLSKLHADKKEKDLLWKVLKKTINLK